MKPKFNPNYLHRGAVVVAATAAIAPSVALAADQKPMNVIYIMSDDHAAHAIGAYGSRLAPLNPTPVIDQYLADDGMLFTNCFCTNSISAPSRACIMTGQYSHHNGVLTLEEDLEEDQQYLARAFKDMGYQTAMVGKWHLGCEPSAFDFYSVLEGQGTYFDPEFYSSEVPNREYPNNKVKTKGYSSDVITNITMDWLKEKRDPNKPFFIMHHYKAPHDMFEFAPRYKYYLEDDMIPEPASLYDNSKWGSEGTRGKNDSLRHIIGTSISSRHNARTYTNIYHIEEEDPDTATHLAYQEYLKRYLRCVKGVDDNLARLFDYLKKEGLWENTIIVYTGDQGMTLGEHDFQDKRWMYEESYRMPFIVRDPRSHYRGEKTDVMINNIDFAPTLIDMVGGEIPEQMDGRSFAPVFDGGRPDNERHELYYRYWMHMIHHDIPAHIGIRTKDYKLILFYGRHFTLEREGEKSMSWLKVSNLVTPTPVSFELYDMKNDPFESTNLAEDPAYADVMKDMKKRLKKLREEVGDTDEHYPHIKKIIDEALKK
ncbi:MAG: sulfatase [Rikenellaceae bacterium]